MAFWILGSFRSSDLEGPASRTLFESECAPGDPPKPEVLGHFVARRVRIATMGPQGSLSIDPRNEKQPKLIKPIDIRSSSNQKPNSNKQKEQ
jgi:hypothetical protein